MDRNGAPRQAGRAESGKAGRIEPPRGRLPDDQRRQQQAARRWPRPGKAEDSKPGPAQTVPDFPKPKILANAARATCHGDRFTPLSNIKSQDRARRRATSTRVRELSSGADLLRFTWPHFRHRWTTT